MMQLLQDPSGSFKLVQVYPSFSQKYSLYQRCHKDSHLFLILGEKDLLVELVIAINECWL